MTIIIHNNGYKWNLWPSKENYNICKRKGKQKGYGVCTKLTESLETLLDRLRKKTNTDRRTYKINRCSAKGNIKKKQG